MPHMAIMYSALLPKTRKMKAGPLIMKVINSSGIFQNCYGTIMSLNLPGSQQKVLKGMQTEGWFRQKSIKSLPTDNENNHVSN
jgi:hypothetical protein